MLRFCNAFHPRCYDRATGGVLWCPRYGKRCRGECGSLAVERFATMPHRGSLKVLVAEEDARLRRIVRLNLQQEGLEVVEASSIRECQARLHEGGFDAQSLSAWLRSESPGRAMPVVILSFDAEDRLLTLPLRLAVFRQKPFDPGDLVSQVEGLMRTA